VIQRLSKVRVRGRELALDAQSAKHGGKPKPHRKGGPRR
jgi:hypothetical protein